ncbi:MAG: glutamate ligase domain-containing protein, partial [Spirochaetia bacterium]
GVHGKSTSSALAGTILRALGLPATTVVGSMVPDFGDRAASVEGDRFFVAETCEYRRHFLSFHPDRIMLTGVEPDHLDYYRDYDDIHSAFCEYAMRLSPGGLLVYCGDNRGAVDVASYISRKRPDVRLTEYGYNARGSFAVTSVTVADEQVQFALAGFDTPLVLRIPGRHNAVNCAGVLAVIEDMLKVDAHSLDDERWFRVCDAVSGFGGLKRRSEVVGEANGITILDDYAHHPTAIAAELSAIREFYPGRRVVVDFMSHTYSRTAGLLEEFAGTLAEHSDALFLHRIYASAREAKPDGVTGDSLEQAVRRKLHENPRSRAASVHYIDNPPDAVGPVLRFLRSGDIFITMGAGDNWQVGQAVLTELQKSRFPREAHNT